MVRTQYGHRETDFEIANDDNATLSMIFIYFLSHESETERLWTVLIARVKRARFLHKRITCDNDFSASRRATTNDYNNNNTYIHTLVRYKL